jgi:hypothetical protein
LGDLLKSDTEPIGFNDVFERDIHATIQKCSASFKELETYLSDANQQLATKPASAGKTTLAVDEQPTWPFLHPRLNELRSDLRDCKTNMHLILATASLAKAIRLTSR